jgi:glucose/mannose-6-phosphate isomerase
MKAALGSLPEQIEAVLGDPAEVGAAVSGLVAPENVVVLGMGGSGVAGAALQAFAATRSPVPVLAQGGYECPAFVGERSLVFAVSFSGATEETLHSCAGAIAAGARPVAITSGGPLAGLVAAKGGKVIRIAGGIPQPRAGLGAMLAPLLLACEEVGVLEGSRRELEAAVRQLRRRVPTLMESSGPAAEAARAIGRTIPLVHGAAGLGAVAARRWRTQVNENAKALAFDASQPEASHNEVCGFGQGGDITRQLVTLVELHQKGEDEHISRRFGLFTELAGEAIGAVVRVEGEGEGDLARFLDLVAIGDATSLHLAAAEGVDPGPVPVLTEIKRRLAARRAS